MRLQGFADRDKIQPFLNYIKWSFNEVVLRRMNMQRLQEAGVSDDGHAKYATECKAKSGRPRVTGTEHWRKITLINFDSESVHCKTVDKTNGKSLIYPRLIRRGISNITLVNLSMVCNNYFISTSTWMQLESTLINSTTVGPMRYKSMVLDT